MALSEGRVTARRTGDLFGGPVAASVTIYQGALVSIDTDGYLRPARADETDTVVGIATETVENGSTAGAVRTTVERGIFRLKNTSTDITQDHIGLACYAVDDEQVDIDNNAGARCYAGTIVDVDSSGVWVDLRSPRAVTVPGAAYVAGDILVHNGTGFVRLAKGTDGQVLKMVSGSVAWGADT